MRVPVLGVLAHLQGQSLRDARRPQPVSGSQVPDDALIVTAVALRIWPYSYGLTTVFFST